MHPKSSKYHWIIKVTQTTQTILVPNAKAPLPKVSGCSLGTSSADITMGCYWYHVMVESKRSKTPRLHSLYILKQLNCLHQDPSRIWRGNILKLCNYILVVWFTSSHFLSHLLGQNNNACGIAGWAGSILAMASCHCIIEGNQPWN